ncbi:hypothetical protein [Streptomyces antimycoticus]|uniref:Uncharacterized protein n=1 Tax=Streptomyces mordarskii TaxID=1226758 RepID=A0ABP3NNG8_9ACTN
MRRGTVLACPVPSCPALQRASGTSGYWGRGRSWTTDLLLVFTSGADWAYATAAGLRDRSVVPAVAGLTAGYAGYTLLADGFWTARPRCSPPS